MAVPFNKILVLVALVVAGSLCAPLECTIKIKSNGDGKKNKKMTRKIADRNIHEYQGCMICVVMKFEFVSCTFGGSTITGNDMKAYVKDLSDDVKGHLILNSDCFTPTVVSLSERRCAFGTQHRSQSWSRSDYGCLPHSPNVAGG